MKHTPCFFFILLLLPWFATAQTRIGEMPAAPAMSGFGSSFVIDGDQIIVGRSGESGMFPEPPSATGEVLVYGKQDGVWTERLSITPEDLVVGDLFGRSMALSGDWLAVGAPDADEKCGAVHLFARESGGWRQAQRLSPVECSTTQRMGLTVVFDGQTLIAGAPEYDEESGALYIFSIDDSGVWQQVERIENPDEGVNLGYGARIAAGESGLFMGVRRDAVTGVVHHIPKEAGVLNGDASVKLMPSDTTLRSFGYTMYEGEGELLVGAPGLGTGPPVAGAVVLFEKNSDGWTESAIMHMDPADIDSIMGYPTSIGYGSSISRQGDELWIGAPYAREGLARVFIYRRDEKGDWSKKQEIGDDELSIGSDFGARIDVSGNLAVVNAPGADFGNGRLYILERDPATGFWEISQQLKDAGRSLAALTGEELDCTDGSIGEFGCSDVELLSFLPIRDVGGSAIDMVNDIWGWTDPQTGREYVILGRSFGTAFLDVTDPVNPHYLGSLPATAGSQPTAWRDMKVYANHAFIVSEAPDHGMQVFDLTQLREADGAPREFTEVAHYDVIESAHNIVIDEESGFAFIVGANGGGSTCGGGLHMVDIRDPLNPSFAGCFNDQSTEVSGRGYSHDAQCVIYKGPDEDYTGHEICFGSNETALSIADVTDKSAPVPISTVSYPNVAYAHQGWLTEDHRYFYMNDEGDEISGVVDGTRTIIWDVQELDDPVLAGTYTGETKSSDHNLYVKGNLLYESNYVSGLRILDITNPVEPREVGFIDTVPWSANDPGFAGSWSNYPFFESGTIAVTSIKEGLFLVRYTPRELP